jgi:Sap, sulfolipid-1-addressing protein
VDVASLLTLLVLALALAVQPWSVLAGVLLVASKGGVAKAMAYVAGWVLALVVVAIATVALYPQTPKVAASSPWVSWVQLASGIALGGWLLVRSRRPVATKSDAQPKWMARLDSMSPAPAFVLGAFLPNYVLVVAAVGNVIQAGLPQARAALVMFLFIVVASAGVAAPLLLLVIRREEAPRIYQGWRSWLTLHGQLLVTVVLAVVAVVLVVKGIVGLVAA